MTLISVDPENLRLAAADISCTAALLERGAEFSRNVAVTRHPGWTMQAELAAAGRAWTEYLSGLQRSVEDTAARLRAAAETYAASEWHAVAGLWRGGGGWFG